jgi:hypothetical protein
MSDNFMGSPNKINGTPTRLEPPAGRILPEPTCDEMLCSRLLRAKKDVLNTTEFQ